MQLYNLVYDTVGCGRLFCAGAERVCGRFAGHGLRSDAGVRDGARVYEAHVRLRRDAVALVVSIVFEYISPAVAAELPRLFQLLSGVGEGPELGVCCWVMGAKHYFWRAWRRMERRLRGSLPVLVRACNAH